MACRDEQYGPDRLVIIPSYCENGVADWAQSYSAKLSPRAFVCDMVWLSVHGSRRMFRNL
jgi:hypothetical protein